MEEPKINIGENPQEEAEVPPEDLEELKALMASLESQAKPSDVDQTAEQQKTPETNFVNEEIKEIDKWEDMMGKKQEFEEPVAEPSEKEEEHPHGKRSYTKEQEAEIYGFPKQEGEKEKTPEAPEEKEAEKVPAEKAEGKNEKTEKEFLIEKLDSARKECVDTLYVKEKAENDVKKLSGIRGMFGSIINKITGKPSREDEKEGAKSDADAWGKAYKGKQEVFKGILKEYRGYLIKEKEAELNKLFTDGKIKKEDFDKELEKYAKEVAIETTSKEAIKIYLAKHEKEIEAQKPLGEGQKWEWLKTKGLETAQWYRKLPFKQKMAYTGLLLGGAAGAGVAMGGTVAAAMAGVSIARWAPRILGGMSTAVGTEAGMKKLQEWRADKKISKEFGDKFLKSIQEKNEDLDKKLFDMLGGKKKEERVRYAVAAGAGIFVGSGAAARLFAGIIPAEWKSAAGKYLGSLVPEEMKAKVIEIFGSVKGGLSSGAKEVGSGKGPISITPEMPGAPRVVPEISGAVTVNKGDSVWKILEKQLESRGHFNDLAGSAEEIKAAKTYMIDALKDKVAANPKAFGIINPDLIKPGQKIDFSRLFEDQQKLDEIFNRAQNLSGSEVKNILADKLFSKVAEVTAGQQYLGVTSESLPPEPGDGEVSMGEVLPDKEQVPTGQGPDEGLLRTEQIPELEARAMETGKNYVVNMPPSPEEIAKNFVSGDDYENLLRERAGIDKLLTPDGLLDKSALGAISERVDKAIADTINMNADAYTDIKNMNLEKFMATKPSTLARHLEWRPARGVIDEYLKREKFIDPEKYDLKNTTVGDFFKKIIKIDIRK
jgi:hypothetical protein